MSIGKIDPCHFLHSSCFLIMQMYIDDASAVMRIVRRFGGWARHGVCPICIDEAPVDSFALIQETGGNGSACAAFILFNNKYAEKSLAYDHCRLIFHILIGALLVCIVSSVNPRGLIKRVEAPKKCAVQGIQGDRN